VSWLVPAPDPFWPARVPCSFRANGFPSATRPYLFNGDFVDRGDAGVEVALTLFAWQQLYPHTVHLNRGNHEERSVHALYGFQRECTTKYDAEVYEFFSQAFEHLPLATLVNKKVFVLHGGVDEEMTIDSLAALPRADYAVNLTNAPSVSGMQPRRALVHPAMRARMAEVARKEEALRPINSALWNDPMRMPGTMHNKHRGTGLLFGANVVEAFCARTGVELVLRSHEQVLEGFDWPFGDGRLLATIFSASNYAGKTRNKAAYGLLGAPGSTPRDEPFALIDAAAAGGSGGFRSLATSCSSENDMITDAPHRTSSYGGLGDGTGTSNDWSATLSFGVLRFVQWELEHIAALQADQRNLHLLCSLVFAHKQELAEAYRNADKRAEGALPVPLWAAATQEVLRLPFTLLKLRRALLGSDDASLAVDYAAFLNRFALARPPLTPLFPLRDYLLALLYRLDADATGVVSVKQLATACVVLHGCFGEQVLGLYTILP